MQELSGFWKHTNQTSRWASVLRNHTNATTDQKDVKKQTLIVICLATKIFFSTIPYKHEAYF